MFLLPVVLVNGMTKPMHKNDGNAAVYVKRNFMKKQWCPTSDSNRHYCGLKPHASTNWANRAYKCQTFPKSPTHNVRLQNRVALTSMAGLQPFANGYITQALPCRRKAHLFYIAKLYYDDKNVFISILRLPL